MDAGGGEEFIMAFRHVGKEVMSVAVTRSLAGVHRGTGIQGETDGRYSSLHFSSAPDWLPILMTAARSWS